MIKLIDSTRDIGNGSVLTLFADAKSDFDADTITIVGFSGEVPAGSKVITADGNNGFYKSDGSIAWQGSTPPTSHPHFTLQDYDAEDHVYYFEEEMTWGDFVESEYNTDAVFSVGEEYILWNGMGVIDGDGIYQSDGNSPQPDATYGLE